MHTLEAALAEAFASQGYQVSLQQVLEGRSGRVETVPLLAEDGHAILVYTDPEGRLDLQHLAATRSDLGADAVVVAGRRGEAPGVQCWDRETLAQVLGDAALHRMGWDVHPLPILLDGGQAATDLHQVLPEAFRAEAPALAAPAPAPPAARPIAFGIPQPVAEDPFSVLEGLTDAMQAFALADGPAAARLAPAAPAAAHAPTPAPIPVPPPPPAESVMEPPLLRHYHSSVPARGEGLLWDVMDATKRVPVPPRPDPEWDLDAKEPVPVVRRLPVLVTPRQALEAARQHMGTVDRYELVLQPVHLFDAEVDAMRKGSLHARTEELRVQVHGTDRSVCQVDPNTVDPAGADLLPGHHGIQTVERNLRVRPERAAQEAVSFLKRRFTRVVEVPMHDHDDLYALTERRNVEPEDDDIRLNPLGVFHRPTWRLLGPNGAVEVDAMTGQSQTVQLRTFPDAVVLD